MEVSLSTPGNTVDCHLCSSSASDSQFVSCWAPTQSPPYHKYGQCLLFTELHRLPTIHRCHLSVINTPKQSCQRSGVQPSKCTSFKRPSWEMVHCTIQLLSSGDKIAVRRAGLILSTRTISYAERK